MARIDKESGLLVIGGGEQGSRLDRVLIRQLGAERRSLILRLIRKGNVRVNRKRARPEMRLQAGDRIFLPLSLRGDDGAQRQAGGGIGEALLKKAGEVPVLYEDDWLLAVDKPAGMVVHGGSGYGAGLIEALKQVRGLPELRLAHRLDRDTSGVLLMAKDLASLRHLSEAFRDRDMQKTYFALVAGHPDVHAGRMHARLSKGIVQGGERMVVDVAEGKEAVTDYQVVMEFTRDGFDYALLALHPHSGRTHQLRVQLQQEGHAILGDGKYGRREDNRMFRSLGGRGLALHAWRLRLLHPASFRPLEIRARWPQAWEALLRP